MSDTRKYTEAQKKSAKKWDAANLDRVSIAMPKGKKATIKCHAAAQGESVNSFINRAIDQTIAQDTAMSRTAPTVPSDVNLYSERDNTAPAAPEGLTEGTADGD